MLHAAALLTGLIGLFLALSPDWRGPETIIAAVAAAGFCLLWITRLGGADAESAPYFRLMRLAPLLLQRAGVAADGAITVARRALAADVTLRPALIRIRTRSRADAPRATFAHLVNSVPGALIVDVDDDGMLVHVLQEDAIDAPDLAHLEGQVIAAVGERTA